MRGPVHDARPALRGYGLKALLVLATLDRQMRVSLTAIPSGCVKTTRGTNSLASGSPTGSLRVS